MRVGAFEINEPVPRLKEPHALAMLRPWVDVGSVGSLALAAIERHLHAQELGKLARPGNFFDFTRYRPVIAMREGRREVTVPNSFVSYAAPERGHDFIFMHLLEPHMFGEDYVESVIDLLKTLGVKRYVLLGAMYDAVPHTRPLLVTGTIGGGAGERAGRSPQVEQSTYEGPTTINYLVGQRVTALGMETANLIVHLPQYVQLEEDFSGAARLLDVLRGLYDLPDNLVDRARGEAQYQEISKAVTARLRPIIQQLERSYDARQASRPKEAGSPLAPEIERFLKEMDERFDSGS